jgi:hypothetical protein
MSGIKKTPAFFSEAAFGVTEKSGTLSRRPEAMSGTPL